MVRSTWNFFSAGQIVFGPGAAEQLGDLVRRHRWHRLLIVTDANLQAAGVVARVEQPLVSAGCVVDVFTGGEAEPSVRAAEAAVAAARAARPDAIVGLGGGSNMDLAKITAVVLGHGGRPQDYFGFDRVPGPVSPLICVPTTAGTGSEVSHAAVLTDTEQQIKVSTLSQHLRPALAVVDPVLTYGCPRQVTADSGIDALTHAIEAYTASDFREVPAATCGYEGSFPLADVIAERAIELIAGNLRRAVEAPDDPAAREAMALAATLAGLAFSNAGVALVHALEYPIGAAVHCSHGAGNGLLLPHVMRFNLPRRTARLARVARLMGESLESLDESAAAERAIEAVARLARDIGIPERLRDFGATESQLAEFAQKAADIQRLRPVNPRPYTHDELMGILREAF